MPSGQALTEAEVMMMIAELRCGTRKDEVAEHLGCSERTVQRYIEGNRNHLLTPEQQSLLKQIRKSDKKGR